MLKEEEYTVYDNENQTEEQECEGNDEGDLQLIGEKRPVIGKNDRSISELFRWFNNGRLIIDPEWQRQYVWDEKRASKLIESCLMDIPVPVIYLAQNNEVGQYEVIDGVQRLTSIFNFLSNKLNLKGLEFFHQYNKKNFKDLPVELQNRLEDYTFRTFELPPSISKNLLFIIFERLNTGGVSLKEMEIRNCVFRGKLNILIKNLSENESFKSCLNEKNISKRMKDRGLVLRFLAFYEKHYSKVTNGLKDFLNDFFETYRDAKEDKLQEFRRKFQDVMAVSYTIFGDYGFRLLSAHRKGQLWSPSPNAAVFQAITYSFSRYDKSRLIRAADSIYEEYLDLISTDQRWVDSVRRSTGDSSNIRYTFETWQNRLDRLLEDFPSNDSQRLFSKRLKQEMWFLGRIGGALS